MTGHVTFANCPFGTTDCMSYTEFVAAKARFDNTYGHQVDPGEIHSMLLPHQRDLVRWAVAGGRRAIFAAFGLGKTVMQLEIVRLSLAKHGGGRGLIVMPLGVRIEFAHDANMLGIETRFVRRTEEVGGDGIYLTNYESVRDGKLDPTLFTAVSLDEASVLRSFGSKTYQSFLELFDGVPYRYVATATPSPNRYKELIHYAGYLGVMDTGAALTRWFQRDSTKANNLTLYPHKEREFFLWLNTWAAFVQSPADLGHDATGYDLPPLEVLWHEVDPPADEFDFERDGQGQLVRGVNLGLPQAAAEKRRSLDARLSKLTEIVTDHAEHGEGQIVIWCDLNDEQRAIEKALEDAGLSFSSVYGSLDPDEVERRLFDWKNRDTYALIGKPVMLGQGMNLQQAHVCVYIGVTHKFNDLIQSLHRIQRFGQTHPCTAHLIHSETEREVVRIIREKWAQHRELTSTMTDIIHEYGLDPEAISEALQRSIGCERIEASGEGWLFANNDCVPETKSMGDSSVDLIVTSIPFSNHYEYTPSYNDFGHTDDNAHFWAQMDYLTPQLLRILAPGRIYACHVKDRILFGNVTGAGVPTVSPFHAEAIFHGRKHGFDYLGMITVVTDVVRENNQTYRLGWSEQCKDATKMGVGSPEYILLFHRPQSDRSKGYADTPVTKSKDDYTRARWQVDAHAFWRSSGNRSLTADELAALPPDQLAALFTKHSLQDVYDYQSHVRIGEQLEGRGALPATFMAIAPGSWSPHVWHDVNRMITLNGEQKRRNVQMHVCLARGSLVLTKGGYKPIQEVNVGELVLTHRGRWRPVLVKQNTGVRPVVNLRAQGVPGAVMTPDHKVWTRDTRGYASRSFRTAKRQQPRWVEAAETVGSYVNRKLAPEESAAGDLTLWWTIGRWLADGHIDGRGCAVISVGRDKADEFNARIGRFGGNPARELTALQYQLRDPGHELRAILKDCGAGAAGKHLPAVAYTLPVDQARALLDGYLSGDGHYLPGRRRWMASSVSKELMLGIAYLAQRVYGAVASVYPGRPEREGVIQGRAVHMRQDWVLSFDVDDDQRRKRAPILDDGAWMKVRSAEPVGEVETWNLRVAEDESFHAEGLVVKNCPLQFDIVDRLITRFSNPGELVFDPFGGLGTVPLRALKLGRRGRGVELNPGYYFDAVKYLQAEERQRDMPSLFDLEDAS
ncbi:anaerobic ribonucleoside reductase large subunit [Mycobacterium phage Brocalys]|uniref:anaerobic ribonucleoside reductase large subunit n=1 Tax=Mycobacterium phage Brocalys TaxID=1815608 RepID=UPI00078B596D|nr:anaerobic ribonucleoside reductase large subunit [Mycobacterium phage Brocalys]AMS01768.1 DNA methylase [Mycobacterium phage Brocalys]QKO03062.1 DNA helicase [Mycobacterium phage LastJedi]